MSISLFLHNHRDMADESDHLKLLLCVDMLNEGVHVEGISGVIMFRSTISSIIYKQHLGCELFAEFNCTLYSIWDEVGRTVAGRELHREYEEARV